jgi:hypothetical protein
VSSWGLRRVHIRENAEARTIGEVPAPHFMGAIVLEPQPRRGLKGVETYNIIDGQQRLTTLQYFLVALMIAVRANEAAAILPLIDGPAPFASDRLEGAPVVIPTRFTKDVRADSGRRTGRTRARSLAPRDA